MNCAGCLHPNRDALDDQLVRGVPYRTIANTFQLSLGSISRHKHHVREMIQTRTQSEREEHGSALLARVERLVGEAEEILRLAKSKEDFRGANGALGAAAKLLDLCGRLSGELQQANAAGGGFHVHLSKTTVNVRNYGDDRELAALVGEATAGFSVDEFLRLKALVNGDKAGTRSPCLSEVIDTESVSSIE